jgi:hypothetical protein
VRFSLRLGLNLRVGLDGRHVVGYVGRGLPQLLARHPVAPTRGLSLGQEGGVFVGVQIT